MDFDAGKKIDDAMKATTRGNLIPLDKEIHEDEKDTPSKANNLARALMEKENLAKIEQACKANALALAPSLWPSFQGIDTPDITRQLLKKVLPLTDLTGIMIENEQHPVVTTVNAWCKNPVLVKRIEVLDVLFVLIEKSMDALFGKRKSFPKEHQTADHKPITYENKAKRGKIPASSKITSKNATGGRFNEETSRIAYFEEKKLKIEDELKKGQDNAERQAFLQRSLDAVITRIEAEGNPESRADTGGDQVTKKVAIFGSTTWTSALLSLCICIALQDTFATRYVVHRMATMIESCDNSLKRRIFKDSILFFKDYSPVLDALLRAGNRSGDAATDIIDILSRMEDENVEAFLSTKARVVHLNYFFKTFTLKMLKDDETSLKTLQFILKTDPWVLSRTFLSWQKRITISNLDEERLKELKSAIDRQVEHRRRAMTFSPEIGKYTSKRWVPPDVLQANGFVISTAGTSEFLGRIKDQGTREEMLKFIESMQKRTKSSPSCFNVLDLDATKNIPCVLPVRFKDEPWIELHNGNVVGLGLPGLELTKIPPFILGLHSLRFLDLSNNNLKAVTGLESIGSIQYLDLSRNLLTGMHLERTIPVKVLDLHGNFLKELDFHTSSPTLKILDVSRNQIEKVTMIAGLASAKKLGILNLSWNRLQSLSGLPEIPSMVMLFVNGNKMTKLALANRNASTRIIDVSDNLLGGLTGIEAFPSIFKLVANMNYLKNLRAVTSLPRIKHVEANNNQIDALPEPACLNNLALIDLRDNPLKEVKSIQTRVGYMFTRQERGD